MKGYNFKVLCLMSLIIGSLCFNYFYLSFKSYVHKNNTFLKESAIMYNKITVISDDITNWNTGSGITPSVAPGIGLQFGAPDMVVDDSGTMHFVWVDETEGPWSPGMPGGPDYEIMYVNYTENNGWSNATVISDGYNGVYWNDQMSHSPSIATDNNGKIHVAWVDETEGPWMNDFNDYEIMYVSNNGTGWTNATVISDGYNGTYWNDGISRFPSIAADTNGKVHVSWVDTTEGPWGGGWSDKEIMYVSNDGTGWSNATIISDDGTYWNNESSWGPSIGVDGNNKIHVIWTDDTNGIWGSDVEIMYTNYTESFGWSNATVISDDETHWNYNHSSRANIAISNSNTVHVVWYNDPNRYYLDYNIQEIMYVNYTESSGWSDISLVTDLVRLSNYTSDYGPDIAVDSDENVYVVWNDLYDDLSYNGSEIMYALNNGSGWTAPELISDDETNWNDGASFVPSIEIDSNNNIHIVWDDETDGTWGIDAEVMYTSIGQLDPIIPPGDKLPIPLIIVISLFVPVFVSSIIVISHSIYKQEYISKIKRRINYYKKGAHRLTINEVLENEKRKKIIDTILDHPGIHLSELQRKTKIAYGNLVWHLDILHKYHVIKKKTIENFVVYLPYFGKNPLSNIDLKLQKSVFTLKILKIIEDNPGIWNTKISQKINISRKTIEYHIRKLEDLGLIYGLKEGNKNKIYPNLNAEYFSKDNKNENEL